MSNPREYTAEEAKDRFLKHVQAMVEYWVEHGREAGDMENSVRGVAFSILAAIDGSACALPAWVLAPRPHEDDKEYREKRGENWYPDAPEVPCDISGSLHDEFCSV